MAAGETLFKGSTDSSANANKCTVRTLDFRSDFQPLIVSSFSFISKTFHQC